ncbi:MAG: hypothetical protein KN64_11040 [Sulfurovum sp. AS07-7]|nr:MAG: hypothetical protein KN64_11040 [Sulfurovum sp. AS07-7]
MKTIIDCKLKEISRVSFISKKSYLRSVALVILLFFTAGCGDSVTYEKVLENIAPVANSQNLSFMQNSSDNSIILMGSDGNADMLSYIVTVPPSHGTLLGTAPNLKYTPNANYIGSDSFTFKVNDGKVDSTEAVITINNVATPVTNTIPVANIQNLSFIENSNDNIITLSGSDGDGDALTYAISANPSHGTLLGTAPNLKYTPNANYIGSDSFTFKVNDGKVDSDKAVITITNVAEPKKNTNIIMPVFVKTT